MTISTALIITITINQHNKYKIRVIPNYYTNKIFNKIPSFKGIHDIMKKTIKLTI